jgi:hypothetical protein
MKAKSCFGFQAPDEFWGGQRAIAVCVDADAGGGFGVILAKEFAPVGVVAPGQEFVES